MTNYEQIHKYLKQFNFEETAIYLAKYTHCIDCPKLKDCNEEKYNSCLEAMEDWLKEEVQDV